ncbi:MAG: tRNA lysidine(34) synthetase TilS [Candidatus Dadabacteria bacterium]|nr:MAG: tRNA lysidine(34) synthetase TilS [Candidatus Dadabacteria bacterium]
MNNDRVIDLLIEQLAAARAETRCPVAVAVSGGGDSVGLLHLLRAAGWGSDLLRVVHVDHRRRPESRREARFTERLAAELGIRFASQALETEIDGDAATLRAARYAALRSLAAQLGAQTVALAHTLDDQYETRLLAVLRGAGLRGIAGMRPHVGMFWRPLLGVRRDVLRTWLRSRGCAWIDERTNVDFTQLRSRLRHLVLPSVGRPLSGAETLRVQTLQDEDRLLDKLALDAARWTPFGVFALDRFRDIDPVLQRRLLRFWTGPGQGVERIEALRDALIRPDRSRLRCVELTGNRTVLVGADVAVQVPRPSRNIGSGKIVRDWPGIGRLEVGTDGAAGAVRILTAGELPPGAVGSLLPDGIAAPLRRVWPVLVGSRERELPMIRLQGAAEPVAGRFAGASWRWQPYVVPEID